MQYNKTMGYFRLEGSFVGHLAQPCTQSSTDFKVKSACSEASFI